MKRTIFDKIWDAHVVKEIPDGPSIIYIDRHYIHEVTSPQAFSGLEKRGLKVFRPQQTFATCDHNVPTINQHLPISEPTSRIPVEQLAINTHNHGIRYFPLGDTDNGVVHIIGPELGLTCVGMTIVCGDSHTSTHGAFGNIAFGIGTSEVEMVFATQSLMQSKPKQMLLKVDGELKPGVCSKDIILHIISKLGTSAGTGYFLEFSGSAIEALTMEERMTICNMSIEMGARGGLIAPDEVTFNYLKGKEYAPKGDEWIYSVEKWKELRSDSEASYDMIYKFKAEEIEPMITFGTNPGMGMPLVSNIPDNIDDSDSFTKALDYMGFRSGEKLLGRKIDYVFLGSCTNGRIEDFRTFANFVRGKQKHPEVIAWLVPGSKRVEKAIEEEGIGEILRAAGFEVRQPGCSACLGMNEDKVPSGKYCISTSNRNFEGRQGPGARTLLAGPIVAAAASIHGVITDPRLK